MTDISKESVHTILRDHLHLRCVFSSWIPYTLTEAVKLQRVQCAQQLLDLFEELGATKFNHAVEDETVVLFHEPPTKKRNLVWIGKNEKRPQCVASRLMNQKTILAIAYTANKRFSVVA